MRIVPRGEIESLDRSSGYPLLWQAGGD